MVVSTKGRYALQVMIDLAEQETDNYIPLKEITGRLNISEKYMEGIIKILVAGNLLEGVRGKGGGYRLTRQSKDISVAEILGLTEGDMLGIPCVEDGPCGKTSACRTYSLWQGLDEVVNKYFSGITLEDLKLKE